MDIDKQAEMIAARLDIEDLKDPEKLAQVPQPLHQPVGARTIRRAGADRAADADRPAARARHRRRPAGQPAEPEARRELRRCNRTSTSALSAQICPAAAARDHRQQRRQRVDGGLPRRGGQVRDLLSQRSRRPGRLRVRGRRPISRAGPASWCGPTTCSTWPCRAKPGSRSRRRRAPVYTRDGRMKMTADGRAADAQRPSGAGRRRRADRCSIPTPARRASPATARSRRATARSAPSASSRIDEQRQADALRELRRHPRPAGDAGARFHQGRRACRASSSAPTSIRCMEMTRLIMRHARLRGGDSAARCESETLAAGRHQDARRDRLSERLLG